MPGRYPPAAGLNAFRASLSTYFFGRADRLKRLRSCLLPLALASFPAAAWAQGHGDAFPGVSLGTVEVIQLAMFSGVMGAALLSAVYLIRERGRTAAANAGLNAKVADLNASLQRAEALLSLRDQRLIIWAGENRKPELLGGLPVDSGAPEDRSAFLAFGRWLMPRSAAALEHATASLRDRGLNFDLVVETQSGNPIEIQGRVNSGQVFARFLSLSEAQRTFARARLENGKFADERETMISLLDALKMPVWTRAKSGSLSWVNRAYAQAVEADRDNVVEQGIEFLGSQAREALATDHARSAIVEQKLATVIAGDRRLFQVVDVVSTHGSAGLASDISAVEAVREDYERTVRSHADTLDQVGTAVAIFDAREKLRFFNQAFQKLWNLDSTFLDSAPDNTLFLDRLRSEGKLEEQPEWRRWKEGILGAYRAVEAQEHLWHLPDGRTIRVNANPQPKGGVTWVFENLTERIDLESRYNTVVRVQGETLDSLAEGVAVFGPDGRVRLSNPAFCALWGLELGSIGPATHISALRSHGDLLSVNSPWISFVAAATGFDEERRDLNGHTELKNGTVLRYAVIHLPNGQVMITFVDVTDSVNVERALKDKNDALQRSDQLKNEFVQHVSYELRSPLTNIIGFTDLLALPTTGPLTTKQGEYLDHIGSSSAVLLTIINDILDLATVDAGIMELEISDLRVERAIEGAADLVADRLQEHSITLALDTSKAPRAFLGDETRVRQILYNLLSNAANYAPVGSTITLTSQSVAGGVEFSVHDNGPGMSPEVLDAVFKRFQPKNNGGRRRGAGLGLALVKSFVELHGGSVRIDTSPEHGTTVSCFFPASPRGGVKDAAE